MSKEGSAKIVNFIIIEAWVYARPWLYTLL